MERLIQITRTHRGVTAAAGAVVVLSAIYLVSKREDSKVVYQDVEHADFSGGKILPGGSDIYEKKERVLTERLDEIEDKLDAMKGELAKQAEVLESRRAPKDDVPAEQAAAATGLPPTELTASPVRYSQSPSAYSVSQVEGGKGPHQGVPTVPTTPAIAPVSLPALPGPAIISFPKRGAPQGEGPMTVKVPSGSFVKAKLLTGVEAPEGKALPVLLQADYAFVGPNKTKIDLSGCFLIAKSTGNLSIERVEMQASKISCVAKNGRMFEREINGFVADDKDNSFAVMGPVNSKQDRVATMAFLSSVVQGISNAIGQAQTSTLANAAGGTSTMITGDQGKYIAAGGASNAAGVVTQWYLNHAQNLLPTINVGSGQDVWIVMQETVELPNWYFKKGDAQPGQFSFLSKLTE